MYGLRQCAGLPYPANPNPTLTLTRPPRLAHLTGSCLHGCKVICWLLTWPWSAGVERACAFGLWRERESDLFLGTAQLSHQSVYKRATLIYLSARLLQSCFHCRQQPSEFTGRAIKACETISQSLNVEVPLLQKAVWLGRSLWEHYSLYATPPHPLWFPGCKKAQTSNPRLQNGSLKKKKKKKWHPADIPGCQTTCTASDY